MQSAANASPFEFSAPLKALDEPAAPSSTSSRPVSCATGSATSQSDLSSVEPGGDSPENGHQNGGDGGAGSPEAFSAGGYACPTCGHRFRRKNGLSRHMRSHTGEKPFACTLCKFRSTRTDSLQRHMKLHTNPNPSRMHPHRTWTTGGHQLGFFSDAAGVYDLHSRGGHGAPILGTMPAFGSSAYGFPDGVRQHRAYHSISHPYAEVRTRSSRLAQDPRLSNYPAFRTPGMAAPAPMEMVNPGLPAPLARDGLGLSSLDSFGHEPSPMASILKPTTGPLAHHHRVSSGSLSGSMASRSGSPGSSLSAGAGLDMSFSTAGGMYSTTSWTSPVIPTRTTERNSLSSLSSPGTSISQPPAPSHHRSVWNAQQHEKMSTLIIPPPSAAVTDTCASGAPISSLVPPPPAPAPAPPMIPQITITEGFPSTSDFDFGQLFTSALADESALGFDSYISQAASLFSPTKPVSMEEQQQNSLTNFLSEGGDAYPSTLSANTATAMPPPAAALGSTSGDVPHSNRHLSLFVKNFNRHMPFIHVPTIPQLFDDILDMNGEVKMTNEAKQIDHLKPCTEDVLRAMAIVGASYDGMTHSDHGYVPVPEGDASGRKVTDASPLTADWYGASELKMKLLGDFADQYHPPSTVRATFAPASGPDSLFKDFLQEPTLLRRAQALVLLQFLSLFSQSRAHQNHARLLHGALITIGRELLTETAQREGLARQLAQQPGELTPHEAWRQWSRQTERKRTIWAIAVCDALQTVLFRVPPFLQPTELAQIDLSDLGDEEMWHATSEASWTALKQKHSASFDIPQPDAPASLNSALSALLDSALDDTAEAQLSRLGPLGNFAVAISLLAAVTQAIRLDSQLWQSVREAAGVAFLLPEPHEAVEQVRHSLALLDATQQASVHEQVDDINRRIGTELDRLLRALRRFRMHARIHVPAPHAGAAGWVEESASILCTGETLIVSLRSRSQNNSHDLAEVLTLAPPAPLRQSPDQTERLMVSLRRALRSPSFPSHYGITRPTPHPLVLKMTLSTSSHPDDPLVDPTSFRGFFPRLH